MASNYALHNDQRRISTVTAPVAFPYALGNTYRQGNSSRITPANAQIQGQVAGQSFNSATFCPTYDYGTYPVHMHQQKPHQGRDVGPAEQATLASPYAVPLGLGNPVTTFEGNQPYDFDINQGLPTYATDPYGHCSLNGYTNTGYANFGSAQLHPTLPVTRPETIFNPGKMSVRSANPQKPHFCTFCGKSFARKGDMERHFRIHWPPSFSCDFEGCGKGFTRKDKLKEHQRTHDAR